MFVAFRQCSLLIFFSQPFCGIFFTFQDPHAFHRFPSHSSSTLYTLHHHVPIISPHFPIMSPSFHNFPRFFRFPHHFHPPKLPQNGTPKRGPTRPHLCRLIRRQQRVQHHQLSGTPTVARRRGVRVQRSSSGEEQHRVAREVLMFAPQGHHLAMPLGEGHTLRSSWI